MAIVMLSRLLDLTVWSAMVIHLTIELLPIRRSLTCLSAGILERLGKIFIDVLVSASGGEVLIVHRSSRKHTQGVINDGEGFQGVRTSQYQICHQPGFIVIGEHHTDLGKVETTQEVQ